MIRVATNPAAEPGGLTSSDSVSVSLSDCQGQQATVDLRSVKSTIPNATARKFQTNPDSDDPADTDPKVAPTTRMIEVRHPASCQYALQIAGYKRGAFGVQLHAQATVSDNAFLSFDAIPVYSGSRFELKLVYQARPFKFEIEGELRPANAAFSFAQPLASNVQLPAEEKTVSVMIFYDQALASSSFQALLDGNDQSRRFHPHPGQQELVQLPLSPGLHELVVQAKKNDGPSVRQDFHIQRR